MSVSKSAKQVTELVDMETMFVSIVDFGANGKRFLTVKRAEAVKAPRRKASTSELPDAAFAVISPGGKKDPEGKTSPRSLRHLPHHTSDVKNPNEHTSLDIPRLRNALSRVVQRQTKLSATERAKALNHLRAHARAVGVGRKEFDVMLDSVTGELIVNAKEQTVETEEVTKSNESVQPAEAATPEVVEDEVVETPAETVNLDDYVQKDVHEKAVALLTKRNEVHETWWAKKAAKKAIALQATETVRDMQLALRRAIDPVGKQLVGTTEGGWHSVKDVTDGAAILAVVTDDLKLYSVPFSRNEKGEFSFQEPEEVVERTVYEPANATKKAALALKSLGALTKTIKEESAKVSKKFELEKAESEAQAKKAAEALKQLRGGAQLNGASGDPPQSSKGDDVHWPQDLNGAGDAA